jgi:uncharacterized membrane protein YvlD (DUF360 family)
MTYFRSFILNFLAVLFIAHFAPGIATPYHESGSSFFADVFFAVIVGFLNTLIFPVLIFLEIYPTKVLLALFGAIVSFASFTVIAILPYGMDVDAAGVLVGGLFVWMVSFVTNYLDLRHWLDSSEKK